MQYPDMFKAAVFLRNAAPEEWKKFVECFDAATLEVTVAVTKAEPAEILRLQGRAQAFRSLLQDFVDATNQR